MDIDKHSTAVQAYFPDMEVPGTQTEMLAEFTDKDSYKIPLVDTKSTGKSIYKEVRK